MFRASVSSMDVALLRTPQPGYLGASWCTLRQEISDFLEIASADEDLLFCVSVFAELQWDQAETEFQAAVDAELEALRRMLSHVRPISPPLGSKAWLGWLWMWRRVYAAWATRQAKLMPWFDRLDQDGQPSPMPVSESALRSTVMAFLTTAKALPPMLVRAPPEERRGGAGSAGAPVDAPKAHAAAARPTGGGHGGAAVRNGCSPGPLPLVAGGALAEGRGQHRPAPLCAGVGGMLGPDDRQGQDRSAARGHALRPAPPLRCRGHEGGYAIAEMGGLREGQDPDCRG